MEAATDKRTQTLLDKRLLKVLLVDDEATDRIAVERILRTCSSPVEFVVESAVNLSEAIGNLAEKQYDVVLLDLELPDNSGIETLRQVVKVAPDIPVVVLTELDDEQTGFSALEDGATDYLVKDLPLDVVLVRTIIYAIQRKKIQMQSLKLTHDINERMKELNCLYGISKLVETPGISLEEILEKTVCLIPAGWQYPGITCARIVFEGKEYKTDNFKPSKWTQSADITLQGQKVGTVEVCYMEERPQSDEGPFLGEKRDLIDAIGERLGKIADRDKAEKTQKRLVALIEATPDFVGFADAKDKHIIYVNKAGRKMCGIGNNEDVTKLKISDVHPEWANKMLVEEILPAVVRDGAWTGECAFLNIRDRHEIPVLMVLSSHKASNGEVEVFFTISHDITERKRAEETLRESRATFNLVLNTVPQSIFWKDLEGRYLGCNRVFADAVGLDDPARIVGKTDFDLPWPREEAEAYRTDDRNVLEYNRPKLHIIEQLQQADGHRLWIDTSKMPLCDAHGRPFAVLGVYDDITERKKAEEALRESERKKHAFFDRTFQLVGLTTIDGILIEANKTALEFSGVEASSVLNKPFWQGPWWAHSPELQEKLRQAVEKAARGESIRFEATHVAKDGMLHYVDFSLKPVKDETGKVIFLIPEGSDITGRKQAEESLRESEERYKNLFKANIDGMLIADATTKKFMYANPAICRMLGYSEEELTQMGVADIHPKESLEQVIAEFEAQTSGAKITAKDLQCVRKDGQVISVSINAGTVMIDQTKYLLGIFRDITERKNKEKLILDANRRLEKVSEELSAAKRDLEQKNKALQKVCSELQQRVKEQTAQLAAANRSLNDKGYYK